MKTLRTRLVLESLDGRILPDANPATPPPSGVMAAQDADAPLGYISATITMTSASTADISGATSTQNLQAVVVMIDYIQNGQPQKVAIVVTVTDPEGSFSKTVDVPLGWTSIKVQGQYKDANGTSETITAAGALTRKPVGSIMGKVWDDGWNYYGVSYDQDGLQAADGSNGWYGGVTVHLLDANGAEVASTTTDSTGHYLFSGVMYGTYQLKFDLPVGGYGLSYQYTAEHAGSPDLDSDVDANGLTDTFILDPFQTVYRDAGVVYTEQ